MFRPNRYTYSIFLSLLIILFIRVIGNASFVFDAPDFPVKQRLGQGVNSSAIESHPVLSADRTLLFFSRDQHPLNFGLENKADIWVSQRMNDGSWGKAVNLGGPINNGSDNFPVAVFNRGNRLYFISQKSSDLAPRLYFSEKDGRIWSNPERVVFDQFDNYSNSTSYSISFDEKACLIAVSSDATGTTDLWVAFRNHDQQWGTPKLLGETINSPLSENRMFLAADNKSLYFFRQTNDPAIAPGIFMSTRLDDSWTNWSVPQQLHLKEAAKHQRSTFWIDVPGEHILYAAAKGSDQSDLFSAGVPALFQPQKGFLIKGKVINKETQQAASASIVLKDLRDQLVLEELQTSGAYQVVLPSRKNIHVTVEKEGFIPVTEFITSGISPEEELDYYEETTLTAKGAPAYEPEKANKLKSQIRLLTEELDRLEQKKEKRKESSTKLEQKLKSRKKTKLDQLGLKQLKEKYTDWEDSKQTPSLTQNEEGNDTRDAELLEMKKKYQQYTQSKTNDDKETIPPSTPEENTQLTDEVDELKQKFQRYADEPVTSKEDLRGKLEKEVTPKGNTATLDDLSFEQLQEMVWNDLVNTVKPHLLVDIQEELTEEVIREVSGSLPVEFQNKLSENILNKVKANVTAHFQSRVKDQYTGDLSSSASTQTDQAWSTVKMELRQLMYEEVQDALRAELTPEIERELRIELEYNLKKELEAKLRRELEYMLRQQLKDESFDQVFPDSIANPLWNDPPDFTNQKENWILQKDILLIPAEVGKIITLQNVFFDANKARLKPASFRELNQLIALLFNYPELEVEIGGYTNNQCSRSFAEVLSQLRAQVVANYLIAQGIASDRIQYKGYGASKPIASNDTDRGRLLNQRVEVKIIGINR